MASTAKLPPAGDHAPMSVLNHTGQGIRTLVACSCGVKPAKASESAAMVNNSHMAHRRKLGLPRADYRRAVFGEGPWAGMTWGDWYPLHGGNGMDPYTGQVRPLG
jgi:hypothetical protein